MTLVRKGYMPDQLSLRSSHLSGGGTETRVIRGMVARHAIAGLIMPLGCAAVTTLAHFISHLPSVPPCNTVNKHTYEGGWGIVRLHSTRLSAEIARVDFIAFVQACCFAAKLWLSHVVLVMWSNVCTRGDD